MRALRFCFLTTFYPPYHFGGDAIGIQRLARGLVREGHHVTVIHDVDAFLALAPSPANVDTVDDGVETVRLRSRFGTLSALLTQQTGHPVVHGRRIREVLDAGRFDVVNFHNVSLIGGPGLLSYGSTAIRLYMAHEHWLVCPTHVLWRHGRELCSGRQCLRCTLHYRRPPQLWRYTGLLRRQLEEVDTFIAMSEFSRDKHHEFDFPKPMEVLPYFLPDADGDTAEGMAGPPQERPYFLFVGRLERIKGLDDVIDVFRDYHDADLLILGDGEYSAPLRQRAQGLPNVRFLGRVPVEELSRYYRHAVALIVPSVCFETFGIILIEAFRQGTPVIARRLGPFPEIVARAGEGELFDTADELVGAMRRLQGDPDHRNRLAQAGADAFQAHWSERTVVPQYLDIVRRTAERTGRQAIADSLSMVEVQ